jgi:hypothetical protein
LHTACFVGQQRTTHNANDVIPRKNPSVWYQYYTQANQCLLCCSQKMNHEELA